MTRISTWSFGRGWPIMLTVTGAVMVSTVLVARPSVQDPEAVRAWTEAFPIPGAHSMSCTDARRARVPCDFDGLQLRRFPDGSVVLTLLHPNHDPQEASSMNLYIPPDPRVAELQQVLTGLTAGQNSLTKRLDVLESRR